MIICRVHYLSFLVIISCMIVLQSWKGSCSHHHGGRTQYHEQHGGSYKYGFDSGDHYNPQSRHEECDGHGNCKGHFSYVDGYGKKITVYYKNDHNGFFRSDDPANKERRHYKMKHHGKHHGGGGGGGGGGYHYSHHHGRWARAKAKAAAAAAAAKA